MSITLTLTLTLTPNLQIIKDRVLHGVQYKQYVTVVDI